MNTDEQAIRDHHATWIAAVNAADVARLLPMMSDDVVLLSPGQATLGREGFPAVLTGAHEQLLLRCDSELLEVVVAGDFAYSRCRDALTITPRAGGETTRLAGNRLTVYRRHADGRWLLARDAHTLTPVPAADAPSAGA